MGLTSASTGRMPEYNKTPLPRKEGCRLIALAGNPNVGKSTVFNDLTGLRQHTGNWPGKTVGSAQGRCRRAGRDHIFIDIPGAYSLYAQSAEEEAARDQICFGSCDAIALICDATALCRNLNLVLQVIETGRPVALAVNMLDEAGRRGLKLDLAALSRDLGVPVAGVCASRGQGVDELLEAIDQARPGQARPSYGQPLEQAASELAAALEAETDTGLNSRWLALRLLENDQRLLKAAAAHLGYCPWEQGAVREALQRAYIRLSQQGIAREDIGDLIATSLCREAAAIADRAAGRPPGAGPRQLKADRLLTSPRTGVPVMLLLLALVFFLTLKGANWPAQLLADVLFRFQDVLSSWFIAWGAPEWLHGLLVLGIYRVLAWVVAAMLPPMAIFFPLFTLLEDLGYLPRVAFNLDSCFRRCQACGKQALTMCMGFGCNAAGVVGCRIIDSPRERLLAILTNSLVPCNGKFPFLIVILSAFFIGAGAGSGLAAAGLLTVLILLGVAMTLLVSRLLSATVLKGLPSSFTLELPPYRKPQLWQTLWRSLTDRVIFVLGRAVVMAAPAGAIIWLASHIYVGSASLLSWACGWLDPFGQLLGLDGVIIMAFILGLPANEIVLPIIVMGYLASGDMVAVEDPALLRQLLMANGWTALTALNALLFSLFHWPCSTTLLTVWKETASLRWTALALALPTACGILLCLLTTAIFG